ncbi:MAG: pantoate--beta-alanine ligase [Desulfobacterales bacterium]|jgi:pantoate--beta-alanine ligase|nr:pantoate--beta-alanine ligase [Desulfobacterales bacterium]
MQARAEALRAEGQTIAFVPTMGYLHEGHLSLMREGRRRCDVLVVSIFVNPTQFGPGEDLDTYPQDLAGDTRRCREVGADIVFTPGRDSLYTPGFQTYVSLQALPGHLCGLSRPVFFRGVATVVTKLFNIVRPHVAVFGMKDYQQLIIIRRMAADLNFAIDVVGAPTVREPDGLAMSSRNAYLKPEERPAALTLYRSLQQAQSMVRDGERDPARIIVAARGMIAAHPATLIDYVRICDPHTLEDVAAVAQPAVMALAVKVGTARLIDNAVLTPA